MNAKIFTLWELDPVSTLLETGYYLFNSRFGVDGLAKENGTRLDILAVHSRIQGHGMFRNFIHACQDHYDTICMWHVDNPLLAVILRNYGFGVDVEIDLQGIVLPGMRWDKPTPK